MNGNTKHGLTNTREYRAWHDMKSRCYAKGAGNFAYYGGRGISVCERWRDSFVDFLADVGQCPEGMSLDRIDPSGNYEPGNCRWVTHVAQMRNRGNTRFVLVNGEKVALTELAATVGIGASTLQRRLDSGWTVERATSEAVNAFCRPRRAQSAMVTARRESGEPFRAALIALRRVRGLSQAALATAGSLSREEISKLEHGHHRASSLRIQDGLAKGFGVPLDVIRQLVAGSMSVLSMAEAFGVPAAELAAALAVAEQRAAEREAA